MRSMHSMEFEKSALGFWVPKSKRKEAISYPEEGNEVFFNIEERSQWFSARNKTITWLLGRYPFKGAFIDVGGGNGYQLAFLQNSLFSSSGISSALCEPGAVGCKHSVERGVENVYCATANEFPFDEYDAGAIGLFDVIEHLEDDAAFVSAIGGRVKSGTRFYITVPALESLTSAEDRFAGHYRRYNKAHTQSLAKRTGFRILYESYLFSYYVPLVCLLRVLPERLGQNPSDEELLTREEGHHNQSSIIKAGLNLAHYTEQIFRGIGIRPMFGTSRIIVLEKP